MKRNKFIEKFLVLIIFSLISFSVWAEKLKPFILASNASGDFAQVVTDAKSKLNDAGFELIGEYSPYDGATILIVTNDALKNNAKETEFGGYGAIQRVAITDKDGSIQLTFTNPVYMAHAYRLKGTLDDVAAALKSALGETETYGSDKGLDPKELQKYHYMFGMPYFDEPDILSEHGSYDDAITAVEAGLAANKGGASKVYRLDLPGKQQSIFGVAMTKDMSSDVAIMKEVDFKDIRSSAHLPYELLVHEDGKVYALSAKFRIAINFPDLSMAGKNSFMGIMAAPDDIKKVLTQASGGEIKASESEFDF
jgi:hypothetical protein